MTLKLGVPSKGRLMEKTFEWFERRGIRLERTGDAREYAGRIEGIEGMAVVAMGLAAGCLLALVFGRWLQSVLYGVEASDPRMFAATTLLLTLVALASCALPAARASRVDPLVALRQD